MNPIYSSRAEWMITPRSASLHAARLGIFLLMKIFPISFTAPLLAHPSSPARAAQMEICTALLEFNIRTCGRRDGVQLRRRHCTMMKLTPLSEDFPACTQVAECISICNDAFD